MSFFRWIKTSLSNSRVNVIEYADDVCCYIHCNVRVGK